MKKLSSIFLFFIIGGIIVGVSSFLPNVHAEPIDSMKLITNQIADTLGNPNMASEVQQVSIDEASNLLYGRPIFLITSGESLESTTQQSRIYDDMMNTINNALLNCVYETCNDPKVQANAKKLLDMNYNTLEIKQVLETRTGDDACDVHNPDKCPFVNDPDEPLIVPNTGGTIGTDKIWKGFAREIRSPFFINAPFTTPQENIMVLEGLWKGECTAIVKEIQGVKVIVRPTFEPIWQEPWYARAKMIGWQVVWVLEFIPAEFVKTISYCNVDGKSITMDYDIDIIVERELTHFWRFLDKGM